MYLLPRKWHSFSTTDFIVVGQFDTLPVLQWESMCRVTCCKKPSMVLKKHRISGLFSALFLIYPSVYRGRYFSWKVEQGSGFYACRKHSSEWWPKEVRSEAITTEEGKSLGSKSYCEAALRFVLFITKVAHTNERNQHFPIWIILFFQYWCASQNSIVEMWILSHHFFLILCFNNCWGTPDRTVVMLVLI